MARHNDFGRWGEQKAAEFLVQKGYRIIERNWKSNKGEIDIIAIDRNVIVFVEVKSRQKNYLVAPELAVDWKKTKALCATANFYLKYKKLDLEARFDIVTVVGETEEEAQINHIVDAFGFPYR